MKYKNIPPYLRQSFSNVQQATDAIRRVIHVTLKLNTREWWRLVSYSESNPFPRRGGDGRIKIIHE